MTSPARPPWALALVAAAALLLAAPAAAGVQLGLYGDPHTFGQLTGQKTTSRTFFIGWDQGALGAEPTPACSSSAGTGPTSPS